MGHQGDAHRDGQDAWWRQLYDDSGKPDLGDSMSPPGADSLDTHFTSALAAFGDGGPIGGGGAGGARAPVASGDGPVAGGAPPEDQGAGWLAAFAEGPTDVLADGPAPDGAIDSATGSAPSAQWPAQRRRRAPLPPGWTPAPRDAADTGSAEDDPAPGDRAGRPSAPAAGIPWGVSDGDAPPGTGYEPAAGEGGIAAPPPARADPREAAAPRDPSPSPDPAAPGTQVVAPTAFPAPGAEVVPPAPARSGAVIPPAAPTEPSPLSGAALTPVTPDRAGSADGPRGAESPPASWGFGAVTPLAGAPQADPVAPGAEGPSPAPQRAEGAEPPPEPGPKHRAADPEPAGIPWGASAGTTPDPPASGPPGSRPVASSTAHAAQNASHGGLLRKRRALPPDQSATQATPTATQPSPSAPRHQSPGYVGDRPPTYDAEPSAWPVADPERLGDIVADTVLDGARYGLLTLRVASMRGDSARYRGRPRGDALLTARFGSGDDALLFIAVASGPRVAQDAARSARDACQVIGTAVGRSHARLADDIRSAHRGALKSGLQRLVDRASGKLRAARLASEDSESGGSLRCLLLPVDPECRTRVSFGIGSGGLFRLRDGEWQDLDPASDPAPDAASSAPDSGSFRFRASVAHPGDTLLLCSAGLADPVRGEPELSRLLAERWGAGRPPGIAAFLADAQTRVKGYADDRTAIAVWDG